MSGRAAGKYALGICDRSGLTFKLHDLYPQIVDGKDSGLRVSRDMLDEDQPQNFLGEFPINDPQALPFTRTDTMLFSREEFHGIGILLGIITDCLLYMALALRQVHR